jgi:hypothetical protein
MADATFTALCTGGPLDGERVSQTCPAFLAADKLAGKAWLYRKRADGSYAVDTNHDNTLVYPAGPKTGERKLDWARMPLSTDSLPVVSVGDSPEAYAGDPVDDGWGGSA